MNHKAVVLGSNFYIGLSVIRCLGTHGMYTVAMDYSKENTYGAKSKYLSEQIIVPHYKEQEDELVKFLIEYSKQQEGKPVLFATVDPYVEFVDAHLDELKPYYLINMTEQGFWSSIMDKAFLHTLASKHGVRLPETVHPLEEGFEDKVTAEIGFPCIVKPTDSPLFVSTFRAKIFICKTMDEVRAAVKKANDANLEVVVQRIIPGFDDHVYTFDAYLDQNSKVTHWMTCQKQRQFPIHFGASTYTKQKYVEELYTIGAPFLEAIGYKGFAEIEFKKDAKTGEFYLLEINARTTTLNSLLHKCGINFPLLAYNELTGKEIGSKALREDTGIAFCFLTEDLISSRQYVRNKELTRTEILKSYFRKKAPAVWSFKDPAPAFSFTYMMLKKVKKKLVG
ncbi:Predicted ATP-dependent carboligase, ATP-grasp superfamily [Paenibacillus uliginis N3/975]|uniref:Predicted ATP-dependent carboligase, ATP-grasp superfamily n=1 Tax=Paenibacillus uliginis N3/975 TaxID=1313296 RepID=A0A1X7HK97_9BACL|nr:carboxylate--amine ligase [Paenibacillus uliginis]SMF87771.1 Predicted ATP-dependent carboligase, ATP-grasp superfamily [Paenibacillus uliginis N3/975]